jgi:hypothetical protein
MFDLTIMGEGRVIFKDTATAVLLDGESTEYEFMSFHADTIGVLRKGNIVIDNSYKVPIQGGIAVMCENKCLIIVEE